MTTPPPLRNDCFALPPGVNWVPVDDALDRLRAGLSPLVGTSEVPVADCAGRVLAEDVAAITSNPPAANSAVDGYGFAGGAGDGPVRLPLVDGRAAAGAPFDGCVPAGRAIRILTGAVLPPGVDTVVLEEDCVLESGAVLFNGPLKAGANTRRAGEDFRRGEVILRQGTRLGAGEVGLLAAAGLSCLRCYSPLRVGVISTGDELIEAGAPPVAGRIHDANRPMLLAAIRQWGAQAVDLGRVADNRAELRAALDHAAGDTAGAVDVIVTSGGASAGDEDHVSALMRAEGVVESWRIAMKPGRPLMLGLWRGRPVFGLPGNPVAALVCATVFLRPSLGLLAGAGWQDPPALTVPAAFFKSKKPGRREFLRARLRSDGSAEVFHSEGSGRISGLAWANGLVDLPHDGVTIRPGDAVRFLPFDLSALADAEVDGHRRQVTGE